MWAEIDDGRAYSDFVPGMYMKSLDLALMSDLKFVNEAGGTVNFDFSDSASAIEQEIISMNQSIVSMTAAINELAAVPDTELLQTVATYTLAATPGWSIYSDIVSIRSLDDNTAFILKKDGTNVVDDGANGPYQLGDGEYLDIKFDEIVLSGGKVIVTFLTA